MSQYPYCEACGRRHDPMQPCPPPPDSEFGKEQARKEREKQEKKDERKDEQGKGGKPGKK